MDIKKALDRAQWLCSHQEKCVADILLKLAQWGISSNDGQPIIRSLVSDGYIDEHRYAVSFAREKVRINKWGPKKIEMTLRAKHISGEDIQQAIAEIEQYIGIEMLNDLLQKKAKNILYKNASDLKNKLIRFGISRGFGYEEVASEVKRIISFMGNE